MNASCFFFCVWKNKKILLLQENDTLVYSCFSNNRLFLHVKTSYLKKFNQKSENCSLPFALNLF